MELTTLFNALSEVIFYSIFHGLFVYVFVKFILKAFPELPSAERYKILYIGMIWIFASFIFSFSNAYLSGLEKLESNLQVQSLENRAFLVGTFKAESFLPGYSTWIAIFYLAGLLSQSLMLLLGLFRVNMLKIKSFKNIDLSWNIQLANLSRKLEIGKRVKLSISNDNLVPCTIGFIKPVILFPIALINSLNPTEVEAILLHELAHIKRNDYLFNILQRTMEIVLFFNPVIWLLGKEIRREREYCCDDLVLKHTSNPLIYAQALLQIAENKPNTFSLSLSASGKEKYTLLNRIKRLTNMKTINSNPTHPLFTSLTVLAVFLSLAWMIPAEQALKRQQTNSTKLENFSDTIHLVPPKVPSPPKAASIAPLPPMSEMAAIAEAPRAPKLSDAPPIPASSVIPNVPEPNSIPFPPDTNKLKKKLSSAEWSKHMKEMNVHAEEMKKHFESPEWKKQIVAMRVNAEQMKSQALAMEKQFNSPEWKKKIEDMKQHSLEMKKQFDSPEWKEKFKDMRVQSEEIRKQFDSPEWKKKIEEMKIHSEEIRKQFDSPEWKKQIEEFKIKSQEIKKRPKI